MSETHAEEITEGQRFTFGENWERFLRTLDAASIYRAQASLQAMLGVSDLRGKRFLDAGSGSGLFSLCARRLQAEVVSFDFDPRSVTCTAELKRRYFSDDRQWTVETGSVLDREFLTSHGVFDVVYSWGVLHHTGCMTLALDLIGMGVAPQGQLCIAIYNDQGWLSRYWTGVKRTYNRFALARPLIIAVHAPYLLGVRWLVRAVTGRLKLERGMSMWHDLIDWLGGYPFEVARPGAIVEFYRQRGFNLEKLVTCGGRHGCNEYVFRRISPRPQQETE